jgi:hypothetical protein
VNIFLHLHEIGDMIVSLEEQLQAFENLTKPNTVNRLGAHDEFEPNLFETAI